VIAWTKIELVHGGETYRMRRRPVNKPWEYQYIRMDGGVGVSRED